MKKFISAIKSFLYTNRRILILLFLYFNLFILVSTLVIIIRTRPAGDVKVPSVLGKKFSFVYNSLERNGLKPVLRFEDVYDVEDGVVLAQNPEPGKVAPRGSRVTLTVSRNDLEVEVPQLVGAGLPVVKGKLSNLHAGGRTLSLLTGVVTYIPSDKTPENVVILQSPKAGEKVKSGTMVNLLVSSGNAASPAMPDIKGQAIDLIYDLMLSKGVNVEQDIVAVADRSQSGIIIDQSIPAGTALAAGQTLIIKVGYASVEEHLYHAYEKQTYDISKKGSALVEAFVEDDGGKRLCYHSTVSGEKKIAFVYNRQGNARISVYRNRKLQSVISVKMTRF